MLVDFQKKHGLTPDGKFGPITAKKIVEVFNIKLQDRINKTLQYEKWF